MAIIKCKMCGGDLRLLPESLIAECEYCGTMQTVPRIDNDKKANLYDRANHFRRRNDFDKAMSIYEQILNEDNADAESYWSLVLCRYGIEYVEDPATHKRIPTINRAQFTSIFDDEDYKSALHYADSSQRSIYEAEAKAINEIQKGILIISQNEEPFDVFICYKETDTNGRRTQDSVLAQELYYQLAQEGFKVFFSRITLEDKLGSAYEPYIFAALNSAKVMVVLGTKSEHFRAVWVKNEWSRYLTLIKNGAKKTLIPAYRDMDPYDLPEEFSHLQAQDMSKLGFMQDLVRGIKKIATVETHKNVTRDTVIVESSPVASSNATTFLKRGHISLEDEDWAAADAFFEKVLNIDAECSEAYLGKFFASEKAKDATAFVQIRLNRAQDASSQEVLACPSDENLIKDAVEKYTIPKYFTEEYIRNQFEYDRGYLSQITSRRIQLENEKKYFAKNKLFTRALKYSKDDTVKNIKDEIFEVMQARIKQAETDDRVQKQEIIIKYNKHLSEAMKVVAHNYDTAYQKKEADDKLARTMKKRQRRKTIFTMIFLLLLIVGITIYSVMKQYIIPNIELKNAYNSALELVEDQKYAEAYEMLLAIGDYENAENLANDMKSKIEEVKFLTKTEVIKNCKVGDIIIYGAYEQDNVMSNGYEDIEWIVLEKADNRVLVISKYVLDSAPFHNEHASTYWEVCWLRDWLNNNFIDNAFSDDEVVMIPSVTDSVDNAEHPQSSIDINRSIQDRIFLLTAEEVITYLDSNENRMCYPTKYAVAQGVQSNLNTGACQWWTRSPSINSWSLVMAVSSGYAGNIRGVSVDNRKAGVRPAMWIEWDS